MEIDGYEDLEEIGRGGYAVVYRAHQAAFGRLVAIKVLTTAGLGETDRARFEREALAMGRLSWHPNIVVVHETGTTEAGLPYLIEEYVEGGSLGDKLRMSGPLDTAEAVADLVQLCAAVHTAHEADLLHRDIKPDNALIDTFGRIKLADFGIAAVADSTLTATGMVTATIAHAAPEVLNGARATFQADVYSLGSTLYELLAGTAAFVRQGEESIVPLVVRVTNEPMPDLTPHGVASPVVDIVEKAMAKAPADRPASALLLGQMLQAAQQQLGLRVTDLSVRGTPESRHDETVIGAPAIPVVALTPPPAPAPAPPTPPPAAPTPPPAAPTPPPAPPTTTETPASSFAAPTGTVAVPAVAAATPAPGHAAAPAPDKPAKQKGLMDRLPLLLVVVIVLLAAAIGFVVLSGDDTGGDGENFGQTGETGTDAAETVVIDTGARPFRIAVGDDAAWVTDSRGTTVERIGITTNEVTDTVDLGGEPAGIDVNSTAVWASNFEGGTVVAINPGTLEQHPIDVGDGPRNVSATETAVWVSNIDSNTVSHINVENASTEANIDVPEGPRGIVATDTEVWVASVNAGSVTVIDPVANQTITTVTTGGEPGGGIELAGDSAWVSDAERDVVIRIDRETYEVLGTIPVGADPGGMASTEDTVYVSNSADNTVSVIDAASGEVTGTIETGEKPGGLAVTDTDLWVCNTDADTVSRIPLT